MRNLQELYSERVRDFLHTWEKKGPVIYITMRKRPKSWEYRDFPYREEVELMPQRSWGYPLFWEGESRVVGSLCMASKLFAYKNMRVDHVRPRKTRQYASSSAKVIRQHGKEMYPSASHGSVHIAVNFCLCRASGFGRTLLTPTVLLGLLSALSLVW